MVINKRTTDQLSHETKTNIDVNWQLFLRSCSPPTASNGFPLTLICIDYSVRIRDLDDCQPDLTASCCYCFCCVCICVCVCLRGGHVCVGEEYCNIDWLHFERKHWNCVGDHTNTNTALRRWWSRKVCVWNVISPVVTARQGFWDINVQLSTSATWKRHQIPERPLCSSHVRDLATPWHSPIDRHAEALWDDHWRL